MKGKFALPPLPGQSRQGRPSSGALRHLPPRGKAFLFCNLFYHIFRKCGILKARAATRDRVLSVSPPPHPALRATFPRPRGKALGFLFFTFYSTIFSANVVY